MKQNLLLLSVFVFFVLLFGCTSQPKVVNQNNTAPTITPPPVKHPTPTVENPPTPAPTPEPVVAPPTPSPPPTPVVVAAPIPTHYSITADANGFYFNGQNITSLNASKGSNVSLLIQVGTKGVPSGGLDFKGCGLASTGVQANGFTTYNINPYSDCDISSYLAGKGFPRAVLHIIIVQ